MSEEADGRAVAVIHMKLEKEFGELPRDTELAIRPRSALGLKYIELHPGNSSQALRAGETLALEQSTKPVELDEFFSTWDADMRRDQREVLEGYGNALAGRGASINTAIEEFVPFMTSLEPVMRTLSDRGTELRNFFPELRRTAGQIAPVADTYAELFVNMATTFEALSRHEESLRDTIDRAPDTLEAGVESFPVQRPFLRDSGELAVKLEPVADEIERSLPVVSDAFDTGAPVLEKAPPFYERTERVFRAVEGLMENPVTLLALRDLDRTLEVAAPLVEFVAPYQTVCNYWNYYWTGISEHVSEPVRGGTVQRTNLKSDNRTQDNRLSSSEAEVPVDVPQGQDPHEAKAPNRDALQALHGGGVRRGDRRAGQRGLRRRAARLPRGPDGARRPLRPERGRRPARGLGPVRPARPHGRDLQGARARHRQPGGRAVRERGMTGFRAGVIALVVLGLFTYFGATKQNPFANPYELHAVFDSVNRLAERSPVRIAGVNVGKVTKVEPLGDGSGKARVTMEIQESGLPIREDAELKIRSRLFLEGNYFVELHPGRPHSAELESGGTIGPDRTSAPVQYVQVLTALQSETRAGPPDAARRVLEGAARSRRARLQQGDQALGGGVAHHLAGERRVPRPRAARPHARARRPGEGVRRAVLEQAGARAARDGAERDHVGLRAPGEQPPRGDSRAARRAARGPAGARLAQHARCLRSARSPATRFRARARRGRRSTRRSRSSSRRARSCRSASCAASRGSCAPRCRTWRG